MQLVRILVTIAVGLGWIIGTGVARAKMDEHRLPQYPRPEADRSSFWLYQLGEPSRYRASGQRWVLLYWVSQLGPIVLIALFVQWWG